MNSDEYHYTRCLYANSIPGAKTISASTNKCGKTVDLGFLLDSSGSLKYEYAIEKKFLKRIISTFNVDSGQARAGVVTFSYDAELRWVY